MKRCAEPGGREWKPPSADARPPLASLISLTVTLALLRLTVNRDQSQHLPMKITIVLAALAGVAAASNILKPLAKVRDADMAWAMDNFCLATRRG